MFEKLRYLLLEYKPRRKCIKCSEEKFCGDFYWLIKGVYRRTVCKKCCGDIQRKNRGTAKGKAADKKYRESAKRTAATKKYAASAKGKATQKKYAVSAKGKVADKKKIKKYNKTAKGKATYKKYRKSAKGKAAIARGEAKRRSKIEGIINDLTKEQWEQILNNQKHCCNGCKTLFTEEKPATKDHITPVDKDGGLTKENIQALCGSCNSIKGPRPMKYLVEALEKKEV